MNRRLMCKGVLAFLALGMLTIAPNALSATEREIQTGAIMGKVVLPNGNAVPGAMVEAFDLRTGKLVAKTDTDNKGGFKFSSMPEGGYTLIASTRTLGAARIICNVRADAVTRVVITLGPTTGPRR